MVLMNYDLFYLIENSKILQVEQNNPKLKRNIRKEKPQTQGSGYNYQNNKNRRPQMPRITDDMKRIRDVSPRFLENKRWLVSKYREYGIDDGDVWTTSSGEGMSYQSLLKMPFYEDCHKLPENVVIKKGMFVVNEKQLNWDDYFVALQKNFQVGITSKAKVSKQIKEKGQKQSQSNANAEDLYEGKIEWDEIQQPPETEKSNSSAKQKYKMQFKQITEVERCDILKEIEKDEVEQYNDQPKRAQNSNDKYQNMANFLKSAVKIPEETSGIKNLKIISVEEIENRLVSSEIANRVETAEDNEEEQLFENFFDDENGGGENHLAISKENKEIDKGDEEETVEFENVEVSDLKKLDNMGNLASLSASIQKEIKSDNEGLPFKNFEERKESDSEMKVISAEDLDKMQTQSIAENYESELSLTQNQNEMQMNYSQNTFSTKQNNVNNSQYKMNPEEIKQQYLINQIDQINQEEIKTAMMKNVKLNNQYQKAQSSKSFMHYIPAPDPETNPFESFLKKDIDNCAYMPNSPTSQWYYKDPQGCVRGPFSCFDMYTWHSQGYFNEDLELSLDSHHFFTLKELRMLNQDSHTQVNMYPNQGQYIPQNYAQMVYQPEVNQMYGYSPTEHQPYYQYQVYPTQQYQYQENYYPQYNQPEYYPQANPNPAYYSTYVHNNYYENQ